MTMSEINIKFPWPSASVKIFCSFFFFFWFIKMALDDYKNKIKNNGKFFLLLLTTSFLVGCVWSLIVDGRMSAALNCTKFTPKMVRLLNVLGRQQKFYSSAYNALSFIFGFKCLCLTIERRPNDINTNFYYCFRFYLKIRFMMITLFYWFAHTKILIYIYFYTYSIPKWYEVQTKTIFLLLFCIFFKTVFFFFLFLTQMSNQVVTTIKR